MIRYPIVFTSFLLGSLIATGQESRPLPEPPFLRSIPANTKWVIESEALRVTPGATPSPENEGMTGEVLRRESVKSDRVRQDIFIIAPDTRNERWMASGFLLIGGDSPSNIIVLSDGNQESDTGWLNALDFRELGWVGPATLKGWAKFDDRDALLFEGQISTEVGGLAAIFRENSGGSIPTAGSLGPTSEVRAWIDPETKLPLGYFDGIRTYRYTFTSNVVVPAIPADYRTRLEAYIRRSKSMY